MKRYSVILNVVIPLFIGAIIYYIFSPETLFVNFLDNYLGFTYHAPMNLDNVYVKGIRFYLPDFLWAYALMSVVVLSFGLNRKIVAIIISFETTMEMIQLFSLAKGTFDVCDICVEIAANILVIFLFRRRYKDEKE